jgi:hypothetical protein
MKTIKFFLIAVLVYQFYTIKLFPQELTSGYYVVPSQSMDEQTKEFLGNKLKTALTATGLKATDDFFPMFTVIKYDEIETIEMSGIRKTYKTTGEVSVFILFENSNEILSSISFHIEGIGNTIKIAQANAIKNISIPTEKMELLIEKAKNNYSDAIKIFSKGKLADANKFYMNGDYGSAIESASYVPKESQYYKEAASLISKINNQREKRRQELIVQKEYEQERKNYEKQKEYEFELEKLRLEEEISLKKDKRKNRSVIEEGFEKLWSAVWGK